MMYGFQTSQRQGGAGNLVREFFATGATTFQTWVKPQGCTMVYMLAIGSGSGGAGGATGAAGTGRVGGGGGAGGAQSRLLIPAFLLPDILYVQVGLGGLGGAGGASGTAGQRSLILRTNAAAAANHNVVLASGNAVATAGTAAGAAGAGETVSAQAQSAYIGLGLFVSVAGATGAAGGAVGGAVGGSVTQFAQSMTCGGAGGGSTPVANTNNAGGNITAVGVYPVISGGIAGGGTGADGYSVFIPSFYTAGGAGGGSNGSAGVGGAGGNAGIGSGGGGGGAGVTGGAGGRGGDGYVCIVSW
jgi:hypothetical protein